MLSLFLENNPFSDKSNLEIFNDSINLKKFKKNCPNFYAIYETVLSNGYDDRELVTKDNDVYLKTKAVRSTTYDHYSFLKEIMDSPNFSNPLRVFSTDNFIEIFTNQKKSNEGQLDQFLELKVVPVAKVAHILVLQMKAHVIHVITRILYKQAVPITEK
jgi:hypothetical protein